jgi:hypothetical protein
VPHKPAIDWLVALCNAEGTPAYVVAAAVSGLNQIAEIEGAQSHHDMAPVRALALAILAGSAPGQDQWNADTVYVLQRRAIGILGSLRDPALNGELIRIVSDSTLATNLRLSAVETVSKLDLTGWAPTDLDRAVTGITKLATEGLESESAWIRKAIEELVAINLLWGNVYIIDPDYKPPTNTPSQNGSPDRDGGRGMSGGDGGRGVGGADAGGAGAAGGAGLDGGGDRGAGGGGGSQSPGPAGPKLKSWREFDLPNYQLNMVRRRSKALIHVCQSALDRIAAVPSASTGLKENITKAKNVLATAMKDSDEGLTDLNPRGGRATTTPLTPDKNAIKNSMTVKLMEMFSKQGAKLRELLPAEAVQPPAAPEPETQPTTTGASG